VFDWSQRKGWPELVRGWAAAFRADDPVELIIKITRIVVPLIDVQRELVDAIRAGGHDPGACAPITVMERDLSDREMAAFYRDADAFVLPTRGEGWGRPIVEAMASGLPVLVTNWSAPATYLTRSNGFPIEYELVPVPADYPLEAYHGQQWAVAHVDHLADTLRFVAQHPEAARNIGRRAQRDVQQFSIERATTRLVEAIRPYLD
jgi:glycosyltransferase involved in cell wall biosynthesis